MRAASAGIVVESMGLWYHDTHPCAETVLEVACPSDYRKGWGDMTLPVYRAEILPALTRAGTITALAYLHDIRKADSEICLAALHELGRERLLHMVESIELESARSRWAIAVHFYFGGHLREVTPLRESERLRLLGLVSRKDAWYIVRYSGSLTMEERVTLRKKFGW